MSEVTVTPPLFTEEEVDDACRKLRAAFRRELPAWCVDAMIADPDAPTTEVLDG